jgi:hypothetical protein
VSIDLSIYQEAGSSIEGYSTSIQSTRFVMSDLASHDDDAAVSIPDACHRWSSTLSSLAADVDALQHLSSLWHEFEHNENTELKSQYLILDSVVTSIEQKHQALLEIVREEQRALDRIEQSTLDGVQQNERLRQLMEIAKEKQHKENKPRQLSPTRIPSWKKKKGIQANSKSESTSTEKDTEGSHRHPDNPHTQVTFHIPPTSQSIPDPYAPYTKVSLKRITSQELQTIPRTIRGRISLAVLTEALMEIETVCRDKYAHYKKPAWWEDEPWEHPWVSEQELRKACAFFRSGESTARAILLILRNLHRIKQIPAKNLEIVYILAM